MVILRNRKRQITEVTQLLNKEGIRGENWKQSQSKEKNKTRES